MKKLKNKVFFTIYSILTASILIFIIMFNIQNYLRQRNSIVNTLNMTINKDNPMIEERIQDKNIKFMDSIIYTILLDKDNKIKEIINHSNNKLDSSEITLLANQILDSNPKERYIGYLYFDNYSYIYLKNNILIILDNTNIKLNLFNSLQSSLLIFIVLEIIIIFISKIITNWITKPAQDSFDKQKQFIADASHELKTPLSVIIASSEALEENPKEKKWIRNIKNEADRMNQLIINLLDLATSERDIKEELKLENISKIIELSVLTFEGKAFEKNIKLIYNIKENINYKVNSSDIKQLVEILLDNAIKHSNSNENIYIDLDELNNEIVFTVTNKGDEIPAGSEEKIFERFYRVDQSRNRNENRYGLGLSIAKNIVLNHNGTISAKSNNGITTFKTVFKK